MKKVILSAAIFLLLFPNPVSAKDLIQAPAAIQVTSQASEGRYSVRDIVAIAKRCGIKVVTINDRDLMKWEWGLWPLQNLIKKTVENPSIFTYGIKKYLNDIAHVQQDNPDMVVLPGTESAPYYHWKGHIVHDNLTIEYWHKHILTIGLNKEDHYRYLPIISNGRGLEYRYSPSSIWSLIWPILLTLAGIFTGFRKNDDYVDALGRHYGSPVILKNVIMGACLALTGLAFLVNNYPYKECIFSQYGKDAGNMPYQKFIDYVNKRGGLTFWSHPEAQYIGREKRISISTKEHADSLLETRDYTGFAIFYEGYEKVGLPGGIWDDYLKEYCKGERRKPVWAIGGLSFEGDQDLARVIKDLRTVLLVPKLGPKEALDAMRNGSMYVARGPRSGDFTLDNFSIADPESGKAATSGGQVSVYTKPVLKIKGGFTNGEAKTCTIKVIKDGVLIDSYEEDTPLDISYDGRKLSGKDFSYYRIEIVTDGLQVVSNPIFVKHRERAKKK